MKINVRKKCKWCKSIFETHPSELQRGRGKFCSKKCALKYLHSQNHLEKYRLDWTGRKHSSFTKKKMRIIAIKKGFGKWNLGKPNKQKGKPNLKRRGSSSPNWRGGITPKRRLHRKRVEYLNWRSKVFERDDYTCTNCGKRSGNGKAIHLVADHVLPWALYSEYRHEISNGRTLCVSCHKKTITYGNAKIYRDKKALKKVDLWEIYNLIVEAAETGVPKVPF